MLKNPYEILGVPNGSPKDVCKKAYRRLSKLNHPDSGGDKDKFDTICKAWDAINSGVVLSQRIKREGLRHKTLFTFV